MVNSLPFCDGIQSKDRPVLVKSCEGTLLKCYKCTSQLSVLRERYEIQDLEEAGVNRRTFIDYEILSIPLEKLSFKMGKLSQYDRENFGKLD